MRIRTPLAAVLVAAIAMTSLAAQAQTPAENPTTAPPKPELQAPQVERHLKTFDTLDFDVFGNQKWDRLAVDGASGLRALGASVTLDVFPGLGHGVDERVARRIGQHREAPAHSAPSV